MKSHSGSESTSPSNDVAEIEPLLAAQCLCDDFALSSPSTTAVNISSSAQGDEQHSLALCQYNSSSFSPKVVLLWPESCFPTLASPVNNNSKRIEETQGDSTDVSSPSTSTLSCFPYSTSLTCTKEDSSSWPVLKPGQLLYISPNSVIICLRQTQLSRLFFEATNCVVKSFISQPSYSDETVLSKVTYCSITLTTFGS